MSESLFHHPKIASESVHVRTPCELPEAPTSAATPGSSAGCTGVMQPARSFTPGADDADRFNTLV
jgi:hypothetical protein